jgi:hypothetical protein
MCNNMDRGGIGHIIDVSQMWMSVAVFTHPKSVDTRCSLYLSGGLVVPLKLEWLNYALEVGLASKPL